MTANQSVLAHLSPWFYEPIEDRGTDALAYILNKSRACREELDAILRGDDFQLPRILAVDAQDRSSLRSRPDLVGFDQDNKRRLVVEVKFWAVLQPDQAGRYYEKLEKSGSGVLLFICPEKRIDDLWREVEVQLRRRMHPVKLGSVVTSKGMRFAPVDGCAKRVMMVSWKLLLERLGSAESDFEVQSDIHQLRGFVRRLNDEAFLPLEGDTSKSAFERRDLKLRDLIRDAKQRGLDEGWLGAEGLAGGGRRRYFKVIGAVPPWLTIEIRYDSGFERTPIWMGIRNEDWQQWPNWKLPEGAVRTKSHCYLPLAIQTNLDFTGVSNGIVGQLKALGEEIRAICPE